MECDLNRKLVAGLYLIILLQGEYYMDVSIRYVNASDIDALANVHSRSLRAAFKDIVSDDILDNNFSFEHRKNGFTRELAAGSPTTAIAFAGVSEVGLLSFGPSRYIDIVEDTIELWRIYLIPESWGSGIGEELLDWGIEEIRRQGYKRVILWVLEANLRARKFYEKHGFFHDGRSIEADYGRKVSEFLYIRDL
ncbi:MAG: acetyltransferase [Clostridia bacterium]|jgi:ribosomal protein S18 acetylase RimI-like enzyme|nr:acetyltransferase [Clostridia bacterium]